MKFVMICLIKHLQRNVSPLQQKNYLEIICRSEISQFSDKIDLNFFKKISEILERTNKRVNFEELSLMTRKELEKAVGGICESFIDDHRFQTAIEIADLLELPKSNFVLKWWVHRWSEDNNKNFETEKYMKYVTTYNLSMEVFMSFIKKVVAELKPSVKKFNMMKFMLRNCWNESPNDLDLLEYNIISLYVKLKINED